MGNLKHRYGVNQPSNIFDPTDPSQFNHLIISSGESTPGAGYTFSLITGTDCTVCCEDQYQLLTQDSLVQTAASSLYNNSNVGYTSDLDYKYLTTSPLTLVADTSLADNIVNIELSYQSETPASVLYSGDFGIGFLAFGESINTSLRDDFTYSTLSNVSQYNNKYTDKMGDVSLTYISGFSPSDITDNYTDYTVDPSGTLFPPSVREVRIIPADTEIVSYYEFEANMSGKCEGMHSLYVLANILGYIKTTTPGSTIVPEAYAVNISYERCNGYPDA